MGQPHPQPKGTKPERFQILGTPYHTGAYRFIYRDQTQQPIYSEDACFKVDHVPAT